jgi:hypothetical protein
MAFSATGGVRTYDGEYTVHVFTRTLTAATFPTVASTSSATSPYDDDDWVNVNNIKADDTSYATITADTFDTDDYSYLVKAQHFDFAIPSDASVIGIQVMALAACNVGTTKAVWSNVQLLNASGTAEGDNNAADGPATLTAADAVYTFGGVSDKWGVTLTPAMVNDDDFGVQFAIQAKNDDTDVRVEYLSMVVHYVPGGTDLVCTDSIGPTDVEVLVVAGGGGAAMGGGGAGGLLTGT